MKISIENAMIGMKLKETIVKDNTCILSSGTELTKKYIEKLKRLNIDFIDIDSSNAEYLIESNKDVEETVSINLKKETANSLKDFLEDIEDTGFYNICNLLKNSKEIINFITNSRGYSYDLGEYIKQNDIYSHSVRVASFAIALAKIYNDNLKSSYKNVDENVLINLEDIAIAALIHDIAKIYKDENGNIKKITEIPNMETLSQALPGIKDTPLDSYDKKYSSIYSYCLVGNNKKISTNTKLMILLSNEPETENGPLKINSKFNQQRKGYLYGAKIIHLCDIYDKALKQTIEDNKSLEEVVSLLGYYARNGIINSEVEQILINNIPLYSVGTKVELSSGDIAVITKSFTGTYETYKPIILVLPYYEEIDLRKETTITIKSICSKESAFEKMINNQLNIIKKRNIRDSYNER